MGAEIPEQHVIDTFTRQDELLAQMIPILQQIRDKSTPAPVDLQPTLQPTLDQILELMEYQREKNYDIEFFTYPNNGTRAALAAGTTLLDFENGTIKSVAGVISDMSNSLSKLRIDFLRSVAINTDKEIVLQLDNYDKIIVKASTSFITTYKQFTKLRITTTATTHVFVLACTNPEAIHDQVGEVTGDETPFDHEVITVADSAVSLTSDTYDDATRAEMTLETAQIRMWADGTEPTATVGMPVGVDDVVVLNSAAQIAGFKAIRTTGTSGTLSVQYFH